MSAEPATTEEVFARMREDFVSKLPRKVAAIEDVWRAWNEQSPSAELLVELRHQAHRLAGSADMFQLAEVSRVSREVAGLLKGAVERGEPLEERRVRELADRLHELRLEAERLGAPAAPADAKAAPQPAQEASPVDARGPRREEGEPAHAATRRVLLVEDSPEQRVLLESRFQAAGWRTRSLGDGLDAIAEAAAFEPDLIVSGVEMPGLSGYNLCSFLRSFPGLESTPVLLLSAEGSRFDRFWAKHCGAEGFLSKQQGFEALLARAGELAPVTRNAPDGPGDQARSVALGRGVVRDRVAGLLDRKLRVTTLSNEIQRLARTAGSLTDFLEASLRLLDEIVPCVTSVILLRIERTSIVASLRLAFVEREELARELLAGLQEEAGAASEPVSTWEWHEFEPGLAPSKQDRLHLELRTLETQGEAFGVLCIRTRLAADGPNEDDLRGFGVFAEELAHVAALAWRKEALSRKSRELQELHVAKEQLSELLVHDIKNAAAAIGSALEMVGEEPALSEIARKLIRSTQQGSRLLLDMLVGLLDIARMERAELPLHLETLDPTRIAGDLADLHRGQLRHRSVTIEVADLPELYTDRELLSRVLGNLVANAVKHTLDGTVRIDGEEAPAEAGRPGRYAVLRVRDTGRGIDPEHATAVFDKYTSLSPAGVNGRPARIDRGLGLYFCRLAVESLGGIISAGSTPGEGSVFSVELPRDRDTFEHRRSRAETTSS